MTLTDKSIIVTGGAGFIGSWIVELLADDNKVKVLDSFSTGKPENLAHLKGKVEIVRADVRDARMVSEVLKGADIVFHQAANVQIQASFDDPGMDAGINVGGTLNVLEACRKHDVESVVFASSSSVYGEPDKLPVVEGSAKKPTSPYAISKLSADFYTRLYSQMHGMGTVSLRYFNVYGPRQNPDSPYSGVISIFAKNIGLGKPLPVLGDGEQTRDFVSVHDVANANILAAGSKKAAGLALNVGTGRSISLNGMISVLEEISGKKLKIIHKGPRQGDVKHSRADISLAEKVLGFKPEVKLEDGLKELLASA